MTYKELPSIPEYWTFPEVVGQTGIPAGILERMITGRNVRAYLFAESGIEFASYPLEKAFRGAPDDVCLCSDSPVGFVATKIFCAVEPDFFGGGGGDWSLCCSGFLEICDIWGYRGALDGEDVGALLQPYDGRFDVIGNVSGSVKKALLDAVDGLGFDTSVRLEYKRLYFHWQDINQAVARLNSTRPVDAPMVAVGGSESVSKGKSTRTSGAEREAHNNEILLGMIFHAIGTFPRVTQAAVLDRLGDMFTLGDGNENSKSRISKKIAEWKKLAKPFINKESEHWQVKK